MAFLMCVCDVIAARLALRRGLSDGEELVELPVHGVEGEQGGLPSPPLIVLSSRRAASQGSTISFIVPA